VTSKLRIHEVTTPAGELSPVFLQCEAGILAIVADGAALPLPHGAVDAVMARFGAPLDPGETIALVGTLDLGDGRALRHVRHLARYDVIGRDYLVHEGPDREPLCALATTVAGALDHIARALAALPPVGHQGAGA
jgi:hypothetical protein